MFSARRTWLLAGIWVATLVGYLATQRAFQEAETQIEGANQETEKPSYTEGSQEEYAPDRIIVKLEEGATRSDLEELNQQNDASAEEGSPVQQRQRGRAAAGPPGRGTKLHCKR